MVCTLFLTLDEFTWDHTVLDSCGQTIEFDYSFQSIVFSTPTYPHEVLNDRYSCYWYFTCPSGYRISLLFTDFDTYTNSYVYVSDYSYYHSTYQIAKISARTLPGSTPIQSSSNRLTAYYYDNDWDDVTPQRGVLANATMIPSGTYITCLVRMSTLIHCFVHNCVTCSLRNVPSSKTIKISSTILVSVYPLKTYLPIFLCMHVVLCLCNVCI